MQVEVQKGWGVSRIADELARQNVIDSALGFQLYARFSGAGPFQAGTYTMHEHMGASPAAAVLERPPALQYRRLALIPGLTLDMIADQVGTVPGLSRDRFLEVARSNTVRSKYEPANVTSLEGLTWPDTYYVSKAEDETSVLRTIVSQFDKQATRAGLASSADPYRTVIIASLIQTEAKLDVDRPKIAAVIENRLRDDMPLQIDATLLYARGSSRRRAHRRGLPARLALQHVPEQGSAAHTDLDGDEHVTPGGAAPGGRAVQVLRLERRERRPRLRDHLRRAPEERRRGAPQGPARVSAGRSRPAVRTPKRPNG